MKDPDKQIEAIFKSDAVIPNALKNTIREMDYRAVRQKGGIKMKKLIPLLTLLVLIAGASAAYATGLFDVLFQSGNRAIGEALANDYVQNVEMDYIQNEKIKSKVESVIMDDGNLALVFEHILDEPVGSFSAITLQNLSITDESGNVLTCDGDPSAIAKSLRQQYAADKETVKQGLFLESSAGAFPQSQTLQIHFTGVVFYEHDRRIREYQGQWDYSLDLDGKFREAERMDYHAADGGELIIQSAMLTPTGFIISFEIDHPLDAMGLSMKLVDPNGVEYPASGGFSAENEDERPLIHVDFEVSVFEAAAQYQLVVTDTDAGHTMTAELQQAP